LPIVEVNAVIAKPVRRTGPESEGHQHHIGRQNLLTAGNNLRASTALGVGLTQTGLHHLDTLHPAITDNFHRLAIEEKTHAFLAGILHFAHGTGHVGFIAAVDTADTGCTLADRGTVAIHGGITTTQHYHFFALDTDKVSGIFFPALIAINTGHQEW